MLSESAGSRLSPASRWYAVATKVSREEFAVEHLRRQAFETFLPKTIVTKRMGGKLLTRKSAFFPGYLFVHMDINRTGWRAINNTRGVRSLVMTGDQPSNLPSEFVEALRSSTGHDGLINVHFDFNVGDTVRITTGPLTNLIGTLQRMESSQRVSVMVSMMSGKVPVTIETSKLAPAA